MDKKLKEIINLNFFEIPTKKLKNKLLAFKFRMNDLRLSSDDPEIFICNKTSTYDKAFVTNSIENNFVFLKDEVIEMLYAGLLPKSKIRELFVSTNQIRDAGISLVIFPERHLTVFGEFSKIPQKLTDLIFDFGYKKVSFINLIGTYFIRPVWLAKEQVCETKIECKFKIDIDERTEKDYFYMQFNKYMPSSASTYSHKIPIYTRGNNFAEYFEQIFSVCPNCKSFFTLKSEFGCVKCDKCVAAFEFSDNYEINLTKEFSNLDGAKAFQSAILESLQKTEKPIVSYKKMTYEIPIEDEKPLYLDTVLNIYQDKIRLNILSEKVEIPFDKIIDVYLTYDNILVFKYNPSPFLVSTINFKGNNRENLYLIIELLNIYKKNKINQKTNN